MRNYLIFEYRNRSNIPNALTLLRLVAVPLFVSFFALNKLTSAFVVFVFAAITDWLDGYLARKLKVTSSFGAFLDPVADKLMVGAALVMMSISYPTPWFAVPVCLTICREIAVSALREWMAERGLRDTVKVGTLGKVKTALQMLSIILLLLVIPGGGNVEVDIVSSLTKSQAEEDEKLFLMAAGMISLIASAVAATVSGVQYFAAALPLLLAPSGSDASNITVL
eukprot:gene31565-40990_t